MHQEVFDLSMARARLHLSESPFILPPHFLEVITQEIVNLNLYPEPGSVTAINILAKHWGIASENLVISNGCDEAILNTFLKFGRSGNALVSANSYPGYREIAELARQQLKEVPLNKFQQNISSILNSIDAQTKLAIICNPHNPTGSLLSEDEIDDFIRQCNHRNIIPIIDEAYIDYATSGRSLVNYINKYDNIIIWKSFSKSHGLAGIRLGAAVGTTNLIAKLKKAAESNPFSVNRLSQRIVLEIAKDEKPFIENRKHILTIRDLTQTKLQKLGIWYNPSHANFLFLKSPRDLSGLDFYRKSGIFVRDCADYGLYGYWRVSCGNDKEMRDFIEAIENVLSDHDDKSLKTNIF